MTVTDVLNYWNQIGVFSYVIPFLLIFAVVFAILEKAKIFDKTNKAINTIVAASCGLLALQFDMVGMFFSNIFPKMGVGLAVMLVILLFLGFVGIKPDGKMKGVGWVGVVGAVLIVFWALSEFAWFGGGYYGGNFMWWLGDYFWSLVVLVVVVAAIYWVSQSNSSGSAKG